MSESFELAKQFLGKNVEVVIDRPLGTKHPRYGFVYEVNYGYIENVVAPDGENLDAYFLNVDQPLDSAKGKCIAIVHRKNDDDDKLIVVPEGIILDDQEIMKMINFQERWFDTEVIVE